MKAFKVSYSYPLEYPVKVVIRRRGFQGLVAWLMQKYGARVEREDLVITERILEVPMVHEWLGRLFPAPRGKILEIGHVASQLSLELASLGYTVTGIDLRPSLLTHRNLTSRAADFLKADFGKETFDAVIAISTIEHFGYSARYGGKDLPGNTQDEEAFAKIARLLKPNGHFLLTVPYARSTQEKTWFRTYTRADLEAKLTKQMTIREKRYYARQGNEWREASRPADDPSSPHDGCALFLCGRKGE